MRSERVFLAEWLGDDEYTDIPWPMVHEWVGHDAVKWLNSQKHHHCQLVLEKNTGFSSNVCKLYAEFYRRELRMEFALRFAK